MQNKESQESLQKHRSMSFFSFLAENYELSQFVLPKIKPNDDSLDKDEMDKLIDLIMDKDFYEINSIIRKRYKTI
jgi:hypothetical protein